ncbi:MAG: hypothetical protein WCH85_07340 [Methanomicrobiales archaeon]
MESLESKLDRLSPDRRREVEDFVDFLLYRSGSPQGVSSQTAVNQPVKPAPPVIPVMAPMMMQETPPVVVHEQDTRQDEPSYGGVPGEYSSLIHEITVEVEDRISRDYLDYGQFEQQLSPATEAVRKVRTKLIQKSEQEKSHHLDWID